MALGKLGKEAAEQMADAFGDYFLKSRKAIAESDTGRTQPKPAAKYIKEMQRQGVSDEEMKDLGLTEFDPKGPKAQEKFTKQEMLDLIDSRRQDRLQSTFQQKVEEPEVEEYTGDVEDGVRPDNQAIFGGYTAEIGDSDTYTELVYSSTPKGIRGKQIPQEEMIERGVHFREPDQLFHLRLNKGQTQEGEPVVNLLELQSDIQQRAQKGTPNEKDPTLPMVKNWERLGVKEAIKYAVKNNSRYLAIPPGDELARSVHARNELFKDAPVRLIKDQDGKYTLSPVYNEPTEAYRELRDNTFGLADSTVVTPDFPDEALEEMGLTYNQFRQYVEYFLEGTLNDRYRTNVGYGNKIREFEEEYFSKLTAGDPDDPFLMLEDVMSLEEFILDEAITDPIREKYDLAMNLVPEYDYNAWREVDDLSSSLGGLSLDNLKELSGMTGPAIEKAVEEGRPITLKAGEFGGKGLINFYDKTLQSEKMLKEIKVPLVEITQTRPDGTLVKTKAFDLKSLQGKKPKDIPYSLYSLAAGIVTTSGALATMDSEEPKMFNEGGFVGEENNRVAPTGALNEEVADDVPARLSEGEFVLPADVVRYIGLDKLMQLRQEAKAGLNKMEAMGQMGNAEEAVMPDNTPHSEMKFAQGGAVTTATTTQQLPNNALNQQQQSVYGAGNMQTAQLPANALSTGQQSIYGAGAFQTVQNPVQVIPEAQAPVTSPSPVGGYEMRTYRGPNGDVMYVPFMGGQPLMAIPDGYTQISRDQATKSPTKDPEPTPQPTPSPTPAPVDNTGGGDSDSDNDNATGTITGGGTTSSGGGTGGGLFADSLEDKALKKFREDNPDFYTGEADRDKDAYENKALLATGAALVTGGPVLALMAGAKALFGLNSKQGEIDLATQTSDAYNEWLGQTYAGEELMKLRTLQDERMKEALNTDDYNAWKKANEERFEQERIEYETDKMLNELSAQAESKRQANIAQARAEEEARIEAEKIAMQAAENRAAQDDPELQSIYDREIAAGTRTLEGSRFGSREEAQAYLESGFGSEDVFDAIDAQFEALDIQAKEKSSTTSAPTTTAPAPQDPTDKNRSNTNPNDGVYDNGDRNYFEKGPTWEDTKNWLSGKTNIGGQVQDNSNDGGSSPSNDGCCFIMLEARYGDGTMDEVVRRYRDEHMTDRNRRGYYRVAEVLVPLMRKSGFVKWMVTKTFADPLVSYGKYYYGQNKHGVLYSPVKNFWMKLFDVVGGDTEFIRENGEIV